MGHQNINTQESFHVTSYIGEMIELLIHNYGMCGPLKKWSGSRFLTKSGKRVESLNNH